MKKTKKPHPNTGKRWPNRALELVQKYAPHATKVVDAKHDIAIEVTPDDCKTGKRGKHAECALAVACKRAGAKAAIISRTRVYLVDYRGVATRFVVSDGVAREIVAFDRGATFEPGQFILHRPSPKQKIGCGYERSFGPKKRKRAPAHVTTNVRAVLA